ncbi:MAG: hypothetical protein Q8P39_03870 [Candidatus Yanofskybacteria bacterium]|nr:hypothetical protein [Candidatus Yanofskybacteria bacterium]
MLWLYITIGAYFLFAFSSLTDRYLLAGPLPHPRVFAFYTGVTGILASFLIPFGFSVPEPFVIMLALVAGVVSVLGLYSAYRAVYHSGVSRIVPMVGGLFPIFTLFLSILILGREAVVSPGILVALAFFILGTILLSLRGSLREFAPSLFDIRNSLLVAFLFAAGFVLAKLVYGHESFLNGFIWMRWGGFLTAVSLLAFPATREVVFRATKNPASQKRVYIPFLLGKGAGSAAFLMQQYAIFLVQSVQLAVISALQGMQYFFLLLFVGILAVKKPRLLKEEFSGLNVLWRVLGASCIAAGFLLFTL